MNEEERTVQSASFSEPYLLISLDNQSIEVLQADEHGDLDKMPIEGMIKSTKWLTGCLYKDEGRNFNFGIKSNAATCDNILLFLLNHDSELFVLLPSIPSKPSLGPLVFFSDFFCLRFFQSLICPNRCFRWMV